MRSFKNTIKKIKSKQHSFLDPPPPPGISREWDRTKNKPGRGNYDKQYCDAGRTGIVAERFHFLAVRICDCFIQLYWKAFCWRNSKYHKNCFQIWMLEIDSLFLWIVSWSQTLLSKLQDVSHTMSPNWIIWIIYPYYTMSPKLNHLNHLPNYTMSPKLNHLNHLANYTMSPSWIIWIIWIISQIAVLTFSNMHTKNHIY